MYELVQITERSYYIQCPAKIGLVRLEGDQVCLIDSGSDKDAGRKVRQILDANGWRLAAIYVTHSNADHIGGCLLLFSVMAKNMFGEKNGFQQRFYPSPRGTVKFDILDCVYCRYCRKCGCPELIHTFCNTDAYCFGNLSKIRFVREDTLENGEKCDFTLRIKF